jgi:hypothetical protein
MGHIVSFCNRRQQLTGRPVNNVGPLCLTVKIVFTQIHHFNAYAPIAGGR